MKNKEELDLLSKKELESYRMEIFSFDGARRYAIEFELYMSLRFKEDELAFYKRTKKSKSNDPEIIIMQAMLALMGPERLYNHSIENYINDLGDSEYGLY